jgi:PAS domain S-box-containing protein
MSLAILTSSRPMEDLAAARERYLDGETSPAGVRPMVLASWERSRGYGVDPRWLRPQEPSPSALLAARARSRALLDSAEPFLRLMHETLASEPHLVVISDTEGLILRALAGPGLPADLESSNLFEGASWHERDLGCNGIGTALAEGAPVILIGPEHFQQSYTGWTCIGVPIRDFSGAVVGALDLSVPNEHTHVHAWGWSLSVAKGIEAELARSLSWHDVGDRLPLAGIERPLNALRGVFDLLTTQLDLPPTHAAFVDDARDAIVHVEGELTAGVERLRRAERETHRELAEIRAIYDAAPVGLCVLDADLRYLRINDRLAAVNGVPQEAHLGRTVRDVVPDLADEIEPIMRRVLESGEAVLGIQLSGQTAARPGETRQWVQHILPLRDGAGATFGLHVLVEDVTERKRAEREIRDAYERSRTAVQERDSVLAVVSHDLRNPLNTILMASSLLLETVPEGRQHTQATMIRRSVDQMMRLVDDLLDVSRIEGGGLRVVPAPCAAVELIRTAEQTMAPLAASHSLAFTVEAESEDTVLADRERVLQVIANLVSNAIEHTPAEGNITVGCEGRGGPEVVFSVRDTGRGIAAGDLPHVFDRFWQANRPGRAGAGLGLAIAKGIVEAHGGRIWVESREGAGSTFFFTLPTPASTRPGPA